MRQEVNPYRSNNDWPFKKCQVSFHPMTSFKPTTTSKETTCKEQHRIESLVESYLDCKVSGKTESEAIDLDEFTDLHIDEEKQNNSEEESDANSNEWALAVLCEIIIQLYIKTQKNKKYMLHKKRNVWEQCILQ